MAYSVSMLVLAALPLGIAGIGDFGSVVQAAEKIRLEKTALAAGE